MNELPSWGAVANAAYELGSSDFYDALREVPSADLDRAWDRGREVFQRKKGMTKRRLEEVPEEKRQQVIAAALREWRAEPDGRHLLAAAIKVRLALASRPREPQAAAVLRPAFEPGNRAALTHGWRSEYVTPEEQEVMEAQAAVLRADLGEGSPAGDELLVRDVVDLERRLGRLRAYLDRAGELDSTGEPRPALDKLYQGMGRKENALHSLGQTSRSQAKILADRAQGARDVVAGRRAALDVEEELRRRYGA